MKKKAQKAFIRFVDVYNKICRRDFTKQDLEVMEAAFEAGWIGRKLHVEGKH